MADDEFDLARGEYLLAGGISGIFEPDEQFLFVHPFFQLAPLSAPLRLQRWRTGE